MICTEAMTGLGTATMSVWQPSGDEIASGATMIPPASLRMSRRMMTVSSRLADVHRRVVAADVAVAEQTGPATVQLVAVRVGVVGQLSDVAQLVAHCRSPCSVRALLRRTWLNGTPRSAAYSRGKFRTRSPITLRAISVVPPPMLAIWRPR